MCILIKQKSAFLCKKITKL